MMATSDDRSTSMDLGIHYSRFPVATGSTRAATLAATARAADEGGAALFTDVLRRHCDDVGRDYDSIHKTAMGGLDPVADRDGFLARVEEFAAQGIELVTVQPAGPDPVGWTTRVLEDVAPTLADL
jgi:hypothetical protein